MSIHFISGKPGGGKSMYALKLIIEELLYGARPIITNVPINLAGLNSYLQDKTSKVVDVVGRVWVLTDEQTQEFWTYRPGGVRIPRCTKEQWRLGEKPSYAGVADTGVFYCIDEIHNFFGSRQWADTGQDVLFYLSQHRKLGDTVLCVTQAINNVDKQFRSVAQDFTYLRNLSKERFGFFKLPAVFVRKTFGAPATDTSQPMESGTFRLDVSGICQCYDSAVGVGIHGRAADTGERKKGMHWSMFLVITAAVVLGVGFLVPNLVASMFNSPYEKVKAARVAADPVQAAVAVQAAVPLSSSNAVVVLVPPALPVVSTASNLQVTGCRVSADGRTGILYLSDGQQIPLPSPLVTEVNRAYVVFEGQRVRWR